MIMWWCILAVHTILVICEGILTWKHMRHSKPQTLPPTHSDFQLPHFNNRKWQDIFKTTRNFVMIFLFKIKSFQLLMCYSSFTWCKWLIDPITQKQIIHMSVPFFFTCNTLWLHPLKSVPSPHLCFGTVVRSLPIQKSLTLLVSWYVILVFFFTLVQNQFFKDFAIFWNAFRPVFFPGTLRNIFRGSWMWCRKIDQSSWA